YLLAHGLGVPVRDATTTVQVPAAGAYRVWVRTRDWVAPWKAPGKPGRFQLIVGEKPLPTVFGTRGAEWHWQDGGQVQITGRKVRLALHDLTGFEGRCDAVVFSADEDFTPPNKDPQIAAFRRKSLGLSDEPEDAGRFDLVVVGGGIAGTCAALSAARLDLRVALIQDRPVLGGNNSSEVRVWLGGERNYEPYPRIGDVVWELEQKKRAHYGPSNTADLYEDEKKLALVKAEKNIALLLCHRANGVELESGRIRAVIAQHTKSGRRLRFVGQWFADCTGDGCVGSLAGADYELTRKGHMGRCNLWNVVETDAPVPFPRCPWALDLSDKPFPGRGDYDRRVRALGCWYWESGFDRHPIRQREYIRDWNFRAMYGAWDALKNVDKAYRNYKLNWAAHIAGPRESRRLLGDVILTQEDIVGGKEYPDACVPASWSIDLHLPDERFDKGFEGDEFISRAHYTHYERPYWVPYRCLYSRNVPNLFMAGRDISVTHEALGAVRVMRTGGMHDTDPRAVYRDYLDELKQLMTRGVGKAPAPSARLQPPKWLKAAGPNLVRTATVRVSGSMNPQEYPPAMIGDGRIDPRNNRLRWLSDKSLPDWVEFTWERPQTISAARIVTGYCGGSGKIDGTIEDFVLQVYDGSEWSDVPGAKASGNTKIDWHASFPAVRARTVRLLVTATPQNVSRIWEIELYHRAAP
ncbi:MAG: FAD-dependent oxidoreductase, partial [Planctomycetota bacterium]